VRSAWTSSQPRKHPCAGKIGRHPCPAPASSHYAQLLMYDSVKCDDVRVCGLIDRAYLWLHVQRNLLLLLGGKGIAKGCCARGLLTQDTTACGLRRGGREDWLLRSCNSREVETSLSHQHQRIFAAALVSSGHSPPRWGSGYRATAILRGLPRSAIRPFSAIRLKADVFNFCGNFYREIKCLRLS